MSEDEGMWVGVPVFSLIARGLKAIRGCQDGGLLGDMDTWRMRGSESCETKEDKYGKKIRGVGDRIG